MKTKTLLLCSCLLSFCVCNAQNLVPNAGFESYTGCPNSYGQIYLAPPWMNPATISSGASPDYFHSCATSIQYRVPNNFAGHQAGYSGVAYCGLYLFTRPPAVADFREYIEIPLSQTIIPGSTYHFEMNISLSNGSKYTTDDFGIYFSDTIISGVTNYNALPFTPQITNPIGLITDTLNWIPISIYYQATDTANYLIIGNFKDDNNTTIVAANTSGNIDGGFIYIDDVSLTLSEATGINDFNNDAPINIYPNPSTDKVNIKVNNNKLSEVILYDIASRIVWQKKFINTITLDMEQLVKGIYFYEVRTESGVLKQGKVIKQ